MEMVDGALSIVVYILAKWFLRLLQSFYHISNVPDLARLTRW